jgi:hypothetical protein
MDTIAKAYWQHTERWSRVSICCPKEWQATYHGNKIVTQFNYRLRPAIEAAALEKKWVSPSGTTRKPKSPRYQASQVASMDFPSGQRAWSEVAGNRKRFVTKLSTR